MEELDTNLKGHYVFLGVSATLSALVNFKTLSHGGHWIESPFDVPPSI